MRITKFISLLASMAMAVTALTGAMSVSAETDSGDCGEVKWSFDSSTGKLTISGEGEMASPYDGDVVGLGVQYFEFCKDFSDIYTYKKHKEDIKEVVIEKGVTSVGFCAFYQMPNLETVVLPSTITKFCTATPGGADTYYCYSFAKCAKLKNLTLTEGMTAIGGLAFYGCTSLESVRIPTTIDTSSVSALNPKTQWGVQTFADCTSLKNITLPEGLTGIGAQAFENTAVESVVIPSTVQNWCEFPPGNNTSYSNYAFRRCAKLSSVTFKEGLKTIWGQPFEECPLLKKLFIPASVTDIDYAFQCKGTGTSSFEEIAFEDGSQLTEIGPSAFVYCDKLKVLEIPENVVSYSINSPLASASIENVYLYSEKKSSSVGLPLNNVKKVYCFKDTEVYDKLLNEQHIIPGDISELITAALDELNAAVKEANKYSEKDYTAESYGVLKALLDKAATKNEKSHVLGMRYLTEDINSAVKALVKKPAQDSVKPGATKPSNDNKITNTKSQAQKNAENAMKQAKITKLTVKSKAKKKITVTWKKVSKANGYQVQVSTNKKFKKSKIILTKTTSKKKITIKKLKSKKTYFVRVRAYATYKDSNGKPQKVYSSWIKKTRKVKVK